MQVLDKGSFISLYFICFRICYRRTIDGAPFQKEKTQGPNQIPSAVVFLKNALFKAILGIFSSGTYAGLGKQFVSSLKILLKKKKKKD